jgi:3-methyladenine DNA glycosylase AlkD
VQAAHSFRYSPDVQTDAKISLTLLRSRLRRSASPKDAKILSWFFKTAPGEYGAGDRFMGVRVPVLRRLAREFQQLPLTEIASLLPSRIHEERLLALLMLGNAYVSADKSERGMIYRLYLKNLAQVNNWDLVDSSAPQILGRHLEKRSRKVLFRLARSKIIWHRRAAVLATFHFIRQGDFADTLRLGELLLNDTHDLIHKAVGWMLREVGKCDESILERFLRRHAAPMPRTMLRYAIERLPEQRRRFYLSCGKP